MNEFGFLVGVVAYPVFFCLKVLTIQINTALMSIYLYTLRFSGSLTTHAQMLYAFTYDNQLIA